MERQLAVITKYLPAERYENIGQIRVSNNIAVDVIKDNPWASPDRFYDEFVALCIQTSFGQINIYRDCDTNDEIEVPGYFDAVAEMELLND